MCGPQRPEAFQPNRHLEVTPEFLERLLRRLARARIDVVSLNEMHRRFIEDDFKRRFVCLTFEDGYRDFLRWAYPLLRKYNLPFAMYIATSFPDRLGELWWVALETVIAQNNRVGMVVNGKDQYFESATVREKRELHDAVYRYLCSMKTDEEIRSAMRDLCATYSLDLAALCHDLCMDWSEIAELAADPLCTIGAHTVNHMILRKVPSEQTVRAEMEMSRAVIWRPRWGSGRNIWPTPLAIPSRPAHANFVLRRNWVQDGSDYAARRSFQGASRSSDRVAEDLRERRIAAAAVLEGPDVGRRDSLHEPVPTCQRGLDSAVSVMDCLAGPSS